MKADNVKTYLISGKQSIFGSISSESGGFASQQWQPPSTERAKRLV